MFVHSHFYYKSKDDIKDTGNEARGVFKDVSEDSK